MLASRCSQRSPGQRSLHPSYGGRGQREQQLRPQAMAQGANWCWPFPPSPISISPRSSRYARGATRTADPCVQRAYDLLDLSSSSGMAISGAGRGPPPLPLKSTSTACCCGAEVARWEHTRKGTNAYLAESSVPAREGRQLRQFADERVVSLSYMWEVGQWR